MGAIENKMLVESYKWTVQRNDYNIYVQRLILKIIEAMQSEIEGMDFRHGKDLAKHKPKNKWEWFEFELKDLLPEGATNRTHVKEMLESVIKVGAYMETEKEMIEIAVFPAMLIDKDTRKVRVNINSMAVQVFLDFSKGFRRFELQSAMKCRSTYAMRIYQLLSGQTNPLRYSIEELKKMFGVESRYKKNNDFIRYVITPTKKELDAQGAWSFDYRLIKSESNGKGRKSITGIEFIPYKNKEDKNLEKKQLIHRVTMFDMDSKTRKYLTDIIGFSTTELQNNMETLNKANTAVNGELFQWLMERESRILNAKNPKGYIIGALKRLLKKDQA